MIAPTKFLVLLLVLVLVVMAPPFLVAQDAPRAEMDGRIRGYLEAWLLCSQGLGREKVRIAVRDGVVELSGEVATIELRDRILEMARTLDGVGEVVDRLEPGEERGRRAR